jgi:hypothetical protein
MKSSADKQKVEITVAEFMEFNELKEHEKMVKIINKTEYMGHDNRKWVSSDISWKSDGKCWMHLAAKLSSQSDKLRDLVKENKKLKRTKDDKKSSLEFLFNSIKNTMKPMWRWYTR